MIIKYFIKQLILYYKLFKYFTYTIKSKLRLGEELKFFLPNEKR